MKRIIPLLLCAFLAGPVVAQTGNFSSAVSMGFFQHPSNYLKPVDTLLSIKAKVVHNKMERQLFFNDLGTYYSFIGEYSKALVCFDSLSTPKHLPEAAIFPLAAAFSGYQPASAKQAIIQLAAARQVTMINEAHHIPYHRLFTASLLQELYNTGYRYLALEALGGLNDSINIRRYPTQQEGYYTMEPLFADMLRTALKIGYKLVPYEDVVPCTENCRAQRELNQAKNLYKIFQDDPSAKVLVYAGYNHILEKKREGIQRMAGHFKALSGIDPLTVNQHIMTEKSAAAFEDKYYIAFNKVHAISSPAILMKGDSVWVSPEDKDFFDLQVFHPRFKQAHGRPDYFRLDATRKPAHIKLKKTYQHVMVQAYITAEKDAGRLPADQQLLGRGREAWLMLAAGTYDIVVRDAGGAIVETRSLTVN